MFQHNISINEELHPDEDGICRFSVYYMHPMKVKKDHVVVIAAGNGAFLGRIVDELELENGLFEYTIQAVQAEEATT